ncbi:MAG: truB [Chlorobi bacterium]|nr:truB [Chlorobiota bacterium]
MDLRTEPVVISRKNLGESPVDDVPEQGAILLIDKPKGWTSFDVVAKTRGIMRIRKVGHTGTLDPMATGLLILCLGKATKLVEEIQAGIKEYTGTIHFGATTPTDDAESEEQAHFPTDHLTEENIRAAAATFVGESMQVAPMFSARKVDGQRLYKLARRGETVDIPAKPVTIHQFEITSITLPDLRFRVVCSKGTYIRSLARDLAVMLGTGGYLTELRRTSSGTFHVDDALTIQELQEARRPREAAR